MYKHVKTPSFIMEDILFMGSKFAACISVIVWIYGTCLQRRSMYIHWAPTRLRCQSYVQGLRVHIRVKAVGILAGRQPP